MKLFYHLGRYYLLMARAFGRPEDYKIYFKQIIKEINNLGINSIGIVIIVSIFIGAVITIQMAFNLETPLIPRYLIGFATRDTLILEFSSTMIALILAGKVGSNIASELGTMRVTEQIDALEIMGVNSASYLIFPKIVAAMFINPFLNIISIAVGLFGGYMIALLTDVVTLNNYITGLHYVYNPFFVTYSLIKTIVFAFILTTVSAYFGYFTEGGALDVGKSSTKAVVNSSVVILVFNLILTQLLLSK